MNEQREITGNALVRETTEKKDKQHKERETTKKENQQKERESTEREGDISREREKRIKRL